MEPAVNMRSQLKIPPDHPSFAGHFPSFPVLPGAVLLDETLRAIAEARGLDLKQWQIAHAKFLAMVRPGDTLRLEHDTSASGSIRFTVRSGDQEIASGALSHVAAQEGGA